GHVAFSFADLIRVDDAEMDSSSNIVEDDPIIAEFDVILCKSDVNAALYRVQYPTRKIDPYESKHLSARFKRSVKLLEMKMKADTQTGSFDRGKAEHLASILSGGRQLAASTAPFRILDEETYIGRCFNSNSPLHYAIGFFVNQTFYLCPMRGTFEMRRSVAYINERGKKNAAAADADSEEVDSESEQAPGPSPIRVRFLRAETEKQKKRREESSLHRSKLIEQDPWIPLEIHSQKEIVSQEKRRLLLEPKEHPDSKLDAPDPEDLIQVAIIGEKMTQLDLDKCDQLISLRRTRHLPEVEQIRALVLKARIITTIEAMQYVSEEITREVFLTYVQDFAHLVHGVWVIKSEMLYQGEHQTALRSARDLALCLITAGLPVRRSDLRQAFGLSIDDLDSILGTFAKIECSAGRRRWVLRVEPDATFGQNKMELDIMVGERRYWHKRWEQIHRYLNVQEAKNKAVASRRKNSQRRSSGSGTSPKKRTTSATRTVLID
uniref:DNA-directed RNA polymerase III subunit RPC5 n=3 Tax=Parascaris univalens TaxID=6257 RepID=A0A915BA06_PARUN